MVTFSGALDPADANDLAAYHPLRDRQGKQAAHPEREDGGSRIGEIQCDDRLRDAGAPGARYRNPPLQLALNPTLLLDAEGRPLSGEVMLTLGKSGISLTSTAALRPAAAVSATALDALRLATGGLGHENAIARRDAPQPHGAGWLALQLTRKPSPKATSSSLFLVQFNGR